MSAELDAQGQRAVELRRSLLGPATADGLNTEPISGAPPKEHRGIDTDAPVADNISAAVKTELKSFERNRNQVRKLLERNFVRREVIQTVCLNYRCEIAVRNGRRA